MKKPVNILAIDDDAIIRRCCERTLKPAGFNLHTAATGIQGLDLIKENHYDLILVDLKMPLMDGVEVIEQIKAAHSGAKIILVTGYATAETPELVRRMRVDSYIEKPFAPSTLLDAIYSVLGMEAATA